MLILLPFPTPFSFCLVNIKINFFVLSVKKEWMFCFSGVKMCACLWLFVLNIFFLLASLVTACWSVATDAIMKILEQDEEWAVWCGSLSKHSQLVELLAGQVPVSSQQHVAGSTAGRIKRVRGLDQHWSCCLMSHSSNTVFILGLSKYLRAFLYP